jgi:amino acid permease
MKKVINRSIFIASVPYALVGIFGYLAFANLPDELTSPEKAGIIIMANYSGRIEVLLVIY